MVPGSESQAVRALCIYVMHMPSFIRRMQGYARKTGTQFVEKAEVSGVIFVKGQLVGVSGKIGKEPFEPTRQADRGCFRVGCRVRTRLPEDFGVEKDPVPPEDCLFVCLLELPQQNPRGISEQ